MSNIHDVFKDDEVGGVIVGGDYSIGYLCYNGKQQGKQLYADSIEHLKEKANELMISLKKENKEITWLIWPDDSLWLLKIIA